MMDEIQNDTYCEQAKMGNVEWCMQCEKQTKVKKKSGQKNDEGESREYVSYIEPVRETLSFSASRSWQGS